MKNSCDIVLNKNIIYNSAEVNKTPVFKLCVQDERFTGEINDNMMSFIVGSINNSRMMMFFGEFVLCTPTQHTDTEIKHLECEQSQDF